MFFNNKRDYVGTKMINAIVLIKEWKKQHPS
jgi:hypothetical protein